MTVSSITAFAVGLSRAQQGNSSNRASAVLNGLLDAPKAQADAVAKPTEAAALQGQSSQLRQASQQIAQASTFLAKTQTGLVDVAAELTKLGDLAASAAQPETTNTQRASLNTQFQAGYQKIKTILENTQQTGSSAQSSGAASVAVGSGSVDSLSADVLFPAKKPDVLSPSGAEISLGAVKVAGQVVANQQKEIAKLQEHVEFAAGSVEVATQNQDAARSTLSQEDIAGLFSGNRQGGGAPIATSAAQTNRLPSSVLQLLGE